MRVKKKLASLAALALFSVALCQGNNPTTLPSTSTEKPFDVTLPGTRRAAEVVNDKQRVVDFDNGWTFTRGALSGEEPESESYDDSSWEKLNLPHDFQIEQDFTTNANGEIGHLDGGQAWYRKSFVLPSSLVGKNVSITFNGVMSRSTVYVNGKKVGFHPSGYSPFTYDITSYLKFGEDFVNTIAVHCEIITSIWQEQSRWYTGGGIYRDVNLTIQDSVHLATNPTKVEIYGLRDSYEAVKSLPEEERKYSADVVVTSTLESSLASLEEVTVKTTVVDYDTYQPIDGVESQEQKVNVSSSGKVEVETRHHVENPVLWQTWDRLGKDEKPTLYAIKTELIRAGEVLETVYDRFGFRYMDWYSMDQAEESSEIKAAGFYLNGERFEFEGVCLHHDQGALGAVANDYAIQRQLEYMKNMGANAIRSTHNPHDPAMNELCDEMGFVLIAEFFDTWYDGKKENDFHNYFEKTAEVPGLEEEMTWAELEVKSIIERDRNSPSIILWSIANEVGASRNATKGYEWLQRLQGMVHQYDVTPGDEQRTEGQRRYATIGQDVFNNDTPAGVSNQYQNMDAMESVGDNYYRAPYDRTHQWRYYGSETASAVTSRGYYVYGDGTTASKKYTYVSGMNQLSSMDNSSVGWGHTASGALRNQQNDPTSAGEFVWTGFDYIGEPTPWHPGNGVSPKSSYFGITDTAGFAKDNYYLYQSQWLDFETDPMVHIVAHYNWEDPTLLNQYLTPEGKVPVRVYTNAPSVSVFMQKPGEDPVQIGERKTFEKYTVQNDETTKTYQRREATEDGELFQEFYIDQYEYLPGTRIYAEIYDENGDKVTPRDDLSLIDDGEFHINPSNTEVVTADEPYAIKLTEERKVIQADGQALSYIDVEIVDKDGNFCPNADNLVTFEFKGNDDYGKIVGVDNGNADSWERFKDYDGNWYRKAFNGRALVIAQASQEEGEFTIQATSPGLKADAVTIITSDELLPIDKTKEENHVLENSTEDAAAATLYFQERKEGIAR